jgi:hypothetical protein
VVIQQGQVFKLRTRGADGRPLWAYRYRLDGRESAPPQVGGFASRAEAEGGASASARATQTGRVRVDDDYVHRAFANGRLKQTKTRLSNRAVPLQAKAREALDCLPRSVNEILFPNVCGGRIDFRSFGRRHWKPAQQRAGIHPLRRLYDLRHTYATFALRAGVPVFAVSRFMGSSIAMIDYHYGHLAHDSREHAVSLLDALALERAVDAVGGRWPGSRQTLSPRVSGHPPSRSRRTVDARWTSSRRRVASMAKKGVD